MNKIDSYPTHEYRGIKLRPGNVLPFGATVVQGGVNFSIFSGNATACRLALYKKHEPEPYVVIPFFDEFRIGNVYAMVVYGLDCENIEYGYMFDGPDDRGQGHRYDKTRVLLDPYSKIISGRDIWGEFPLPDKKLHPYRSRILVDAFDWQGDKPLETPLRDLIIYEAHVRGLTAHHSSNVKHPGTFAAVRDKIPYLKSLGVNCIKLMPVMEYDEFDNMRMGPDGKTTLMNYWGYNTVGFFAPKAALAAGGNIGKQTDELKTLVRDLHKNGIEVILDIVFSHTAEGGDNGPYISFRGVDNKTYYMLAPDGRYENFSGCGNTLNCNNPVVRNMLLDCLRYWASEYHIDGFRFDLAGILGRNHNGEAVENPAFMENLAFDPVLGRCKMICGDWGAGGFHNEGSYLSWGRRAEWNSKYQEDVRKLLKGEPGKAWPVAQGMQGSPHIYGSGNQGNCIPVNYITSHDGFTLMDLFSYSFKNNFANGENNTDGADENNSWDCHLPGSSEEETMALRKKMVKNALSILMLSHGVPLILAGDEFGNSQSGNNNAYCQDNEISWLNWDDMEKNKDIFAYASALIKLRKSHDCLRSPNRSWGSATNGFPHISFHGATPWNADFDSNMFGVMYSGYNDFVYIGVNAHWEGHDFALPILPPGFIWSLKLASEPGARYHSNGGIYVAPRSVAILSSKN